MWIGMILALALGQEAVPQAQAVAPATPGTQAAAEVAEQPRRRARNGGVSCQHRARTGSVLRQNICTSARRRESDSRTAQDFMGTMTNGASVTPSLDEGLGLTRTPG